LRVIDQENAMGAMGEIVSGRPFHLMPEEDHGNPSSLRGKGSGLSQYLKGRPIVEMIAMVTKNPDFQIFSHGPLLR
jgi:hypothetical protein